MSLQNVDNHGSPQTHIHITSWHFKSWVIMANTYLLSIYQSLPTRHGWSWLSSNSYPYNQLFLQDVGFHASPQQLRHISRCPLNSWLITSSPNLLCINPVVLSRCGWSWLSTTSYPYIMLPLQDTSDHGSPNLYPYIQMSIKDGRDNNPAQSLMSLSRCPFKTWVIMTLPDLLSLYPVVT